MRPLECQDDPTPQIVFTKLRQVHLVQERKKNILYSHGWGSSMSLFTWPPDWNCCEPHKWLTLQQIPCAKQLMFRRCCKYTYVCIYAHTCMHMKTNKTQTHKCKFINKLYNNYTSLYIYIYTECIQIFLYLHIAGHPGHAKHEIRHLAGRPHLQCPAMSPTVRTFKMVPLWQLNIAKNMAMENS